MNLRIYLAPLKIGLVVIDLGVYLMKEIINIGDDSAKTLFGMAQITLHPPLRPSVF